MNGFRSGRYGGYRGDTFVRECLFIGGDSESYEPLSRLPNLAKLAINHWSCEDRSSVRTIVQIRELDLCYTNIEFISNLVNLEILNLSDGQFTDLGPLDGLSLGDGIQLDDDEE